MCNVLIFHLPQIPYNSMQVLKAGNASLLKILVDARYL